MQTILYFFSDSNQHKSALVLAQVLKKFLLAAKNNGLEAHVLYKTLGNENNSLRNAYVSINLAAPADFLKNWQGSIRWIGKSNPKDAVLNKTAKETSWLVGACIWPHASPTPFDMADVQIQTMRSSGAGGQHVNKVSTAVRASHVPTGIQVSASDSRSQFKNKALALERLEHKVQEYQMQQLIELLKKESTVQPSLSSSKVVKTFRGTDFKKESTKKPIKKERQRSKIDIKRLNHDDD